MEYLSPEIEAFINNKHSKSLVRPTISCGIFQEYNDNNEPPKLNYQTKIENNK